MPRRTVIERAVAVGFVLVGALLALADDAAPTGISSVDGGWRFVAGVLVVACATQASPSAWVLSAALAAASSSEPLLLLVGVAGVGLAALGASRFPRSPVIGAGVGVVVTFIAFRQPHDDWLGIATAVGIGICVPLVFAAWYSGPILASRIINGLAGMAVVVGVLTVGIFGWTAWSARSSLNDAAGKVDEAAERFRDGDEDGARSLLDQAVLQLEQAESATTRPWVRATRAVPVFSQHTLVLRTVAERGVATAEAAMAVLDDLDRDALTIERGRVQLDAIEVLAPSVAQLAAEADASHEAFVGVDSRWLLGPMETALADAIDAVDAVAVNTNRAADAIELAPRMLGGDEVRNHLVLLVTPAELRGSGGLIGNWALIEADEGSLRLAGVGRAEGLNQKLVELDLELTTPARYVERYGANSLETEFQDITLSPDFPDVADVARQLYAAAEGVEVDTVTMVDPDGVAALLEITGPVQVGSREMTSGEARQFLLLDQYQEFAAEEGRVFFLERLMAETFTQLLTVDFPDPWKLDEVFGDAVAEGRMAMTAFDPREQALLEDFDVTGSFPEVDHDLIGFVTQNAGQNKMDNFLQRTLSYSADLDPFAGTLEATATIELTNAVPDVLLPLAVIGNNDQGFPLSTNVLELVVYTPHVLVGATIDGEPADLRAREEFGVRSYSTLLEIPRKETVRVSLELEGALDPDEAYELTVPVQAAVSPDTIRLRVAVPDGVSLDESFAPWQQSLATSEDQHFRLELANG